MAVEGFTFFKSFYMGLKNLNNDEYRQVMDAVCAYAFCGERVELDGYASAVFELMLPNIESSISKRESGKKGGRPSKDDEAKTKTESGLNQNKKCLKAESDLVISNKNKDKNKNKNIEQEEEIEVEVEEEKEKEKPSANIYTSDRFNQFWQIYPKKVGKKAALTAWKRANITDEIFQKILDVIDKQKNSEQWQKNNGQFIPNPATWINQGRWDDEPVRAKSPNDYLMQIIQGGDIDDTG